MVPLFITAQSVFQITPQNGKVISNLDMSSFPDLDTAILFQFPTNKEALVEGWSFQLKWIDLDTTGYAHDTIALFD